MRFVIMGFVGIGWLSCRPLSPQSQRSYEPTLEVLPRQVIPQALGSAAHAQGVLHSRPQWVSGLEKCSAQHHLCPRTAKECPLRRAMTSGTLPYYVFFALCRVWNVGSPLPLDPGRGLSAVQ